MELGSESGYIIDPAQAQGEYEDFIGVYRKFVNTKLCVDAIAEFNKYTEANGALQAGHEQFPQGKLGRDDCSIILDDIKIGISKHFYQYLNSAFENYRIKYDHISKIKLGTIGLKMQKTSPGGGYHTWHYENSSFRASNRELAWMIYLNDMPDGEAETEFLFQKRRIKPEIGTIVIWPAGMTHVHRGNTVFSRDKYILTGWYLKLP